MGPYNYEIGARARNAGNDAGLGVGMAELCNDNGWIRGRDRFDLVEEPSTRLSPIRRAVVAVVEADKVQYDKAALR